MGTTTYDHGLHRIDDESERLLAAKQHGSEATGPKGIVLLTACLLSFVLLVIPITYWMASQIAPEAEASEGFVHEPLDRPAESIGDPRTIGE